MEGHRSYNIHRKLAILEEYKAGESGKGLPTLAKKFGISRHTLVDGLPINLTWKLW
jgi:hypothetical protein